MASGGPGATASNLIDPEDRLQKKTQENKDKKGREPSHFTSNYVLMITAVLYVLMRV